MTDRNADAVPKFDRRPVTHVVIERIGDGSWQERARFAEVADADAYVTWRLRHYSAILADVGFNATVVAEPVAPAVDDKASIHPRAIDARGATDQRTTAAWPLFDA